MTNLRTFYDEKATALRREVAVLRQRSRSFVVGELVAFGAAVALAVAWIATEAGWPLLVAAAVVGGIYLWIRSRDMRSSNRLETCEGLLGVYEDELAAFDGDFSRMADEHPDRFHNHCFEIQLAEDITYSYRITPGVARNQNATYLLRQLLGSLAPNP